jgi:hypothetical protein
MSKDDLVVEEGPINVTVAPETNAHIIFESDSDITNLTLSGTGPMGFGQADFKPVCQDCKKPLPCPCDKFIEEWNKSKR